MQAINFKRGDTYLSTVCRKIWLAGKLYEKGDTFRFTVIATPANEFNGNWLKVSVKDYPYSWCRVYLHDLENISQE